MSGCDPQQWRNKNQVLKFQYNYDFKISLHMILVYLGNLEWSCISQILNPLSLGCSSIDKLTLPKTKKASENCKMERMVSPASIQCQGGL